MKRYVASDHIVTVMRGDDFALYNSLRSGSLMIVNHEVLSFLNEFKEPRDIEKILANYTQRGTKTIIKSLMRSGLLVKEGEDERAEIEKKLINHLSKLKRGSLLSGLVLEITKKCNFSCHYCFANHLSKSGVRNDNLSMDIQTAKKAISLLIRNIIINKGKMIEVSFLGGEPLINAKLIREAVCYTNELAEKNCLEIFYSLTTNGSLITPSIADFFLKNKIRISVSLDGLSEQNNLNRIYKNGSGTFESIINGIEHLTSKGVDVTILTTLTDKNIDLINKNFVDFLQKIGITNWGLNLEDFKTMLNRKSDYIQNRLITLSNYALTKGINASGMWFKPIYNLMNSKRSYCMSAQGSFISVEPDGKIYSCSRTSEPIGNIKRFNDLFHSRGYIEFGSKILGNNKDCRGCEIEGHCLGGCPAISAINNECNSGCGLTVKSDKSCRFMKSLVKKILQNDNLKFIE